MKIKLLKKVLLLFTTLGFISCVGDDDYVIPTVFDYAINEGFTNSPLGSGSNEVPINLEGWVNFNETSTRLWHARAFSGNNYAEFSSFFSAVGSNDKAWLITPSLSLNPSDSNLLSFNIKTRFSNGNPLKLYVSNNYDGTTAGIATATWTELNFTMPSTDDVFVSSGLIDLNAYINGNVRIAFKYTGSKSGITTTCQVDDIKIVKN